MTVPSSLAAQPSCVVPPSATAAQGDFWPHDLGVEESLQKAKIDQRQLRLHRWGTYLWKTAWARTASAASCGGRGNEAGPSGRAHLFR